jgi:uncharacterized membrane protein YdcZ (DUF606 family)
MLFILVLPLMIGAAGVLQNTINKKIGMQMGVPLALVLNNLILLACSTALYFTLRSLPQQSLPELFRAKENWGDLRWPILLLPGFFGFFIIATAPWAIERAGATRVFIGIIVAQIVVSILWDLLADAVPVSPMRLGGALLALVGALLAAR